MKNILVLIGSFFVLNSHLLARVRPKMPTESFYSVDTQKTSIKWTGRKVTGSHWGSVKVESRRNGVLIFDKGLLSVGKIYIDMNSIEVLDIKDSGKRASLTAHLKSNDFFATDKYPTAVLKFVKVTPKQAKNTFAIDGYLTIKGITKSISFEATLKSDGRKIVKGSAKIRFNRADYGIKYKSKSFFKDLGDKFIYDDVDIEVSLVAKKKE